jgi:hypothetical protein
MAASFILQFDPTPRPVASYAELWQREPKTLNAWCVKGWIPGAYKHPSGEWWCRPLELLGFDPGAVDHQQTRRKLQSSADHTGLSRVTPRLIYPGGDK